jgi:hypothetical protein
MKPSLVQRSIYMPVEKWDALRTLCTQQHQSMSQVVEHLVTLATLPVYKKESK